MDIDITIIGVRRIFSSRESSRSRIRIDLVAKRSVPLRIIAWRRLTICCSNSTVLPRFISFAKPSKLSRNPAICNRSQARFLLERSDAPFYRQSCSEFPRECSRPTFEHKLAAATTPCGKLSRAFGPDSPERHERKLFNRVSSRPIPNAQCWSPFFFFFLIFTPVQPKRTLCDTDFQPWNCRASEFYRIRELIRSPVRVTIHLFRKLDLAVTKLGWKMAR